MMLIVSGELTPLALGLIGAAIFFAVQLAFCLLAKKRAVRCAPLYLLFLCALLCIAAGMGLFGSDSAGAISGNGLVAVIFAVITGIAAVGDLLAWLAYFIVRGIQNTKRKG